MTGRGAALTVTVTDATGARPILRRDHPGPGRHDTRADGDERAGAVPYRLRSPEQVGRFFAGLELVAPGVVTPLGWRPPRGTEAAGGIDMACGVGHKR